MWLRTVYSCHLEVKAFQFGSGSYCKKNPQLEFQSKKNTIRIACPACNDCQLTSVARYTLTQPSLQLVKRLPPTPLFTRVTWSNSGPVNRHSLSRGSRVDQTTQLPSAEKKNRQQTHFVQFVGYDVSTIRVYGKAARNGSLFPHIQMQRFHQHLGGPCTLKENPLVRAKEYASM